MARSVAVPDIFDSPAVALLCELETVGAVIELTSADKLRVGPPDLLTPQQMTAIRQHGPALKMLVRVCDDGVQDRRQAFERAIATGVTPDRLLLRSGVPYVAGDGSRAESTRTWARWCCAVPPATVVRRMFSSGRVRRPTSSSASRATEPPIRGS